jgi:hypothetical protein
VPKADIDDLATNYSGLDFAKFAERREKSKYILYTVGATQSGFKTFQKLSMSMIALACPVIIFSTILDLFLKTDHRGCGVHPPYKIC